MEKKKSHNTVFLYYRDGPRDDRPYPEKPPSGLFRVAMFVIFRSD